MKFTVPALAVVLAVVPVAAPAVAQDAPPAEADQTPPEQLPVFRTGDADMDCRQISDEAAALSQQMGGAQGGGVFDSVVDVGRAGAVMLIPGAGLALAGADALTRPERERAEARAKAIEQRWYYLNGLYTGLRCGQQPAAPSATPPPPGG